MAGVDPADRIRVIGPETDGLGHVCGDVDLAIRAYDQEGRAYIILLHLDGRATVAQDTDAVRATLAGARVPGVLIGDIPWGHYADTWGPAFGPYARVAIATSDDAGHALILVVMHDAGAFVLPDTPSNRTALGSSGVPLVFPRFTGHGMTVGPAL